MFSPRGTKVHNLTLAASTGLHNSEHVKKKKGMRLKKEGKDREEREREKKRGEEVKKPDDVMHFIVKEGANTQTLFSFSRSFTES